MTTLHTIHRENVRLAGRLAIAEHDPDRVAKCIEEYQNIEDDGAGDPAWARMVGDEPRRELSDAQFLKPASDSQQECEL
jgi:hypothetical protein